MQEILLEGKKQPSLIQQQAAQLNIQCTRREFNRADVINCLLINYLLRVNINRTGFTSYSSQN